MPVPVVESIDAYTRLKVHALCHYFCHYLWTRCLVPLVQPMLYTYLPLIIAALTAWCASRLSNRQTALFINGTREDADERMQLGSGQFFDDIAPTYDLLNHVISLGYHITWRRTAISKILPAASVLDVSTGTGDVALAIATNHSIRVVALDPSTEMLAYARNKYAAAGELVGPVEFVQGSVEELPFEDASFDAVTVAFGVRNFADRSKGLSEIARVLVPNGTVVILEVSLPTRSGPLSAVARFFVKRIVPIMGAIISGNTRAYEYLGNSMDEFPDYVEFSDLLKQAGLFVSSYDRLPPLGNGPDLYVASKPKETPP